MHERPAKRRNSLDGKSGQSATRLLVRMRPHSRVLRAAGDQDSGPKYSYPSGAVGCVFSSYFSRSVPSTSPPDWGPCLFLVWIFPLVDHESAASAGQPNARRQSEPHRGRSDAVPAVKIVARILGTTLGGAKPARFFGGLGVDLFSVALIAVFSELAELAGAGQARICRDALAQVASIGFRQPWLPLARAIIGSSSPPAMSRRTVLRLMPITRAISETERPCLRRWSIMCTPSNLATARPDPPIGLGFIQPSSTVSK